MRPRVTHERNGSCRELCQVAGKEIGETGLLNKGRKRRIYLARGKAERGFPVENVRWTGLQDSISERLEMLWKINMCYTCRWKMYRRKSLPNADPTEGPTILVDNSLIDKAVMDIKAGKVSDPFGIITEMLKISGSVRYALSIR